MPAIGKLFPLGISLISGVLHQWIAGIGRNATHVVLISCHHDVTILTPARSPAKKHKTEKYKKLVQKKKIIDLLLSKPSSRSVL